MHLVEGVTLAGMFANLGVGTGYYLIATTAAWRWAPSRAYLVRMLMFFYGCGTHHFLMAIAFLFFNHENFLPLEIALLTANLVQVYGEWWIILRHLRGEANIKVEETGIDTTNNIR